MKLPVTGIIIALLTTTLGLAPILLQQQSSGAITGGSLNPATRYCAVGTGAGTNRACIPCDIGLGAGNCRDTLTGSTPCPRYGPIPPNCTLDPFNPLYQVPGTTVTPAPGVLDPTLGVAGGGVAQQPTPIPTPPPLFGRNEAAVPPTGGIEQPFAPAPGFQPQLIPRPFTSTPFQQIPQGILQGQDQPFIQSETPPTLSPLPTPPPPLPPPTQTGPTVAPQDSQDDEGGGLPATENQENVPLDDGAAEQPEDDGEQEDSSEGAETAGPLT